MGIVESEAASFAQLKDEERIGVGIGGSEIGIGNGMDSETASIGGSVCVDIDAVEEGEMKGRFD